MAVIPNLSALSGAATGFGTGLGAGLQELASRKISEMTRGDRQARLKEKLLAANYNPEIADILTELPEKDLYEALRQFPPKEKSGLAQNLLRESTDEQKNIDTIRSKLQGLQQQKNTLGQELAQDTAKKSGLDLLKEAYGQGLPNAQAPTTPEKAGQINAQQILEQARLQGVTLTPDQEQKVMQRAEAINSNADEMAKYQNALQGALKNYQSTAQDRSKPLSLQTAQQWFQSPQNQKEIAALRKEKAEEKKASEREQTKIDKQTQKYVDEIRNASKASKDADIRLGRMEELVKKGKLPLPGPRAVVNGLLKRVPFLHLPEDFDLSELGNPDAAEFVSIRNAFLKDAKVIFGSRLTNYDVSTFLKMIPDLAQSDEGKLRLIYNWRILNDAARIKDKALNEIIKENGNKRPNDLEYQVDQRTKNDIDKLAEKFKAGLPGAETMFSLV